MRSVGNHEGSGRRCGGRVCPGSQRCPSARSRPRSPFTPQGCADPPHAGAPASPEGRALCAGASKPCRGSRGTRRGLGGGIGGQIPARPQLDHPTELLPPSSSVSLVNWKHISLCPKPPVHHGGDGALGSEPESPEDQSLFPRTTAESEPALFPTHLKSHFWEKSLKLLHKPVLFLCPSFLFRIHVLESSVPPEADSLL